MSTVERIIKALETVPEKKLRIIELANELVDENGELDYVRLDERQAEVNLAMAEARAYTQATEGAVQVLSRLEPRPEVTR